MRTFPLFFAAIFLFSACCSTKPSFPPVTTPVSLKSQPSLDSVVTAIQDQYVKALKRLSDENITKIEISSLEVSLKVSKSTETGGEIKVLIFKPSATFTKTRSTTVTYVLSKNVSELGAGKGITTTDALSEAIYQSAKSFASLGTTVGGLIKDSFSLDIAFSIKKPIGGSLEFDLWGISADIGAQTENEVEHVLMLTFKSK